MKNSNSFEFEVAKYTFWVSFIIGNLFVFGALIGWLFQNEETTILSASFGYLYLYVAFFINITILLILLTRGIIEDKKRKECFKGIGIMLINIPLAVLYSFGGICLLSFMDLWT